MGFWGAASWSTLLFREEGGGKYRGLGVGDLGVRGKFESVVGIAGRLGRPGSWYVTKVEQ